MPGAPSRTSTSRPESSAMAGSPVRRAAWRALRTAFSTKLRPVSSASGTLNSDWATTSMPRSASRYWNSRSLPALPLASTTFSTATTRLLVTVELPLEAEVVGRLVGGLDLDVEGHGVLVLEVEGRQVVHRVSFPHLEEIEALLLGEDVGHRAADLGGPAGGEVVDDHRDVDEALVPAPGDVVQARDLGLDEAAVEGAEIHLGIAVLLVGLVAGAGGDGHQQQGGEAEGAQGGGGLGGHGGTPRAVTCSGDKWRSPRID